MNELDDAFEIKLSKEDAQELLRGIDNTYSGDKLIAVLEDALSEAPSTVVIYISE